jgi:hypothetical protein
MNITGSAFDDWIYWHFYFNYNQLWLLKSMTVSDSLHFLRNHEGLLFHYHLLGSDLRIGHFFSSRCPLVNTPQLNTELP